MVQTRQEDHVISIPPAPMPKFKGLGATYFEKMQEFSDNLIYTFVPTGEEHTYGSIFEKSVRAAIAMRALGLKPKDVISICSPNTVDCFIPYYAGLFLGLISANFDPLLPLADTTHLLKQVCPKAVFVVPETLSLMKEALAEANVDATVVVLGESQDHIPFANFLLPSPEDEKAFVPYETEDLKETGLILFSSGSSGMPKGICLTHYGILATVYNTGGILPPSTSLAYSNLYWISSVTTTAFAILSGGHRLICPRFDARQVWDLIRKYKVRTAFLTTYQAVEVCQHGRPHDAFTSNLLVLLLGGGPFSKEQIKHIRGCFPNTAVVNCYGQTEINGRAISFQVKDLSFVEAKTNSVGKLCSGFTAKIVDPETEEVLGPNQSGELRLKSEFAMNGYYKMDSSSVWDSEGFLKTGDILYYDEDGCFFVVDRIKDLLKYKMWQISPLKLETIINAHPAVKVSMVVGIPHEVDGDHLKAVVVLKEGVEGSVTEEEIREFVDGQVGDQFRLRAGVKFVKHLPITVNDKFNRRNLKNMVLNGEI